jgi:hypothetical protein
VPAGLPERVSTLAHQWTDGLTAPDAKAHAIEEHLRHEYGYDLKSPSQGQPQPVDHFLFESRRGHCEFFSTAMALMLRTVGIPSRNVTGFVGGTWNRFGSYYAVREGDAHSWVEAYVDNPNHSGWQTFDPTPSSGAQPLEPPGGFYYSMRDFMEWLSQEWNSNVVAFDLRKQVRVFESFSREYDRLRSRTGMDHGPLARLTRGPVVAAVLLLVVTAGYLVWKRRRRKSKTPEDGEITPDIQAHVALATALYRTLEGALQAQGIYRAPSTPPLRHARDLQTRRHPFAEEVLALTSVYLETRFGGCALADADKRDFERRVRELRGHRVAEGQLAPPP